MQKKMLRQKDQEIQHSQEASHAFKQGEMHLREAEVQIEHLQKDLEGVRYSNDVLLDRNYDLKQELESLTSHADLLGN